MFLPISVFFTLQPVAICVDSITLMPTVVVPPATWANALAEAQSAPTSVRVAMLSWENSCFMVCVLLSEIHQPKDGGRGVDLVLVEPKN